MSKLFTAGTPGGVHITGWSRVVAISSHLFALIWLTIVPGIVWKEPPDYNRNGNLLTEQIGERCFANQRKAFAIQLAGKRGFLSVLFEMGTSVRCDASNADWINPNATRYRQIEKRQSDCWTP